VGLNKEINSHTKFGPNMDFPFVLRTVQDFIRNVKSQRLGRILAINYLDNIRFSSQVAKFITSEVK
jgi:hypothetical protein